MTVVLIQQLKHSTGPLHCFPQVIRPCQITTELCVDCGEI